MIPIDDDNDNNDNDNNGNNDTNINISIYNDSRIIIMATKVLYFNHNHVGNRGSQSTDTSYY